MEEILRKTNFISMEMDASQIRKSRDEKELIYWKLVVRGEPVELMLKVQKMSTGGGANADGTKKSVDDAFLACVNEVYLLHIIFYL